MKIDNTKSLREQFDYLFDNRVLENDWKPDWENAYIDDKGNIRCGHCDGILVQNITPFYAKLTGKSPDTAIGFVCNCYHRKVDSDKEAQEEEQKRSDIEKLKKNSCMSEKFMHVTFDDFDDDVDPSIVKAKVRMENYVKKAPVCLEKGYGVMLTGKRGVGKTVLMACTANALMDSLYTVYFTSLADILSAIKKSYNNEGTMSESQIMNLIRTCDFFFLDDVGTTESLTGAWEVSKIQEIVNTRYNSHKPLFMSSNMTFGELSQKGMLPQTVDRLSEMSTVRMVLTGDSYRGRERRSRETEVPF